MRDSSITIGFVGKMAMKLVEKVSTVVTPQNQLFVSYAMVIELS
jgi:hypothetical protein